MTRDQIHQAGLAASERILEECVLTIGGEAGGIVRNTEYLARFFTTEMDKARLEDDSKSITYAELSTILAALREYQREWSTDGGPQRYPPDCACFFEDVEPLGGDEIDSLCERLNCGEIVTITGGPKA